GDGAVAGPGADGVPVRRGGRAARARAVAAGAARRGGGGPGGPDAGRVDDRGGVPGRVHDRGDPGTPDGDGPGGPVAARRAGPGDGRPVPEPGAAAEGRT